MTSHADVAVGILAATAPHGDRRRALIRQSDALLQELEERTVMAYWPAAPTAYVEGRSKSRQDARRAATRSP